MKRLLLLLLFLGSAIPAVSEPLRQAQTGVDREIGTCTGFVGSCTNNQMPVN